VAPETLRPISSKTICLYVTVLTQFLFSSKKPSFDILTPHSPRNSHLPTILVRTQRKKSRGHSQHREPFQSLGKGGVETGEA
jgi:hypothetical protein